MPILNLELKNWTAFGWRQDIQPNDTHQSGIQHNNPCQNYVQRNDIYQGGYQHNNPRQNDVQHIYIYIQHNANHQNDIKQNDTSERHSA